MTQMKQNPFSGKPKYEKQPVESPINREMVPSTVRRKPEPKEVEPETTENLTFSQPGTVKPVADSTAELSDRPDPGDTTPQINPLDPLAPVKKVYPKEEILPLLDSLLQHGYATYRFFIRDTEIILRTRFTWEEQYTYQHLEKSDLRTQLTYQREYMFITIAASLGKYGDYVFEPINKGSEADLDKSMVDRYNFVRGLNSVITDIIQMKLKDFDERQGYIITNFDELLKDF